MAATLQPLSSKPIPTAEFGARLIDAACKGDVETAKFLLSSGADKDYVTPYHGSGVLLHASSNGNEDFVNFWLSLGVDINRADNQNWTALHWACKRNHLKVAEKLILAGADLNYRNQDNETPIDLVRYPEDRKPLQDLANTVESGLK